MMSQIHHKMCRLAFNMMVLSCFFFDQVFLAFVAGFVLGGLLEYLHVAESKKLEQVIRNSKEGLSESDKNLI